ncbi:MAG: hypothetical protein JXR19_01955 [Bacteroidia bacterium]
MNLRTVLLLVFIGTSCLAQAQTDAIGLHATEIKQEIERIDRMDGAVDGLIELKSPIQSTEATQVYIKDAESILGRIVNSALSTGVKVKQLQKVLSLLREVDEKNVHFYTRYGSIFTIIKKVQTTRENEKIEEILKSNIFSSLNLIPFFIEKPAAEPFLVVAAKNEPAELLRHFKEIKRPINDVVVNALAKHAPLKIRTYLYSSNAVQRRVKLSTDPITAALYRMVREQSSASRSSILLHDFYNSKLTGSKAHEISKDDNLLFDYLMKMRLESDLIGEHSVDEELRTQSLKRIRVVNELHDASDAVRFSSISKYNAHEFYTLMVYSEDEIFTSTFLGMYKRMKGKMQEESSYQFLHAIEYNKFRTFIKMCAGYNVLSDFLSMMSDFEKQLLFKRLVEGLENANDNLKSAVAIADTYGSMMVEENRMLLEESIISYYKSVRYSPGSAKTIYSLLIRILGLGEGLNLGLDALNQDDLVLTTLPSSRIFKDGNHIQQHFFFDDPDGRSSYSSFISGYRGGNWRVLDKGTYIVIKSVAGKKVEIYVNKPAHEYAGQRAIKDHFTTTKRWPDVVVHRGHSYFANTSIASLTPNAEIVFLGSCGGYNNINQVLNYSPSAQIISSKQIGTMLVNNRLCYRLNETIRKGEDINWENLWTQVDRSFGAGTTADRRFKDYIPPHKNLGALLIKAYRSGL